MSNKENFEINNDITFTGKKELEELIADYKELKKVLGTSDKNVRELYSEFEGLASVVEDMNKELKAVPTDAYVKLQKELDKSKSKVELARERIRQYSQEMVAAEKAGDTTFASRRQSQIEQWTIKLRSAANTSQQLSGKLAYLRNSGQAFDPTPVAEYEKRVEAILPKLELIVLKLHDMKDTSREVTEVLGDGKETEDTFNITNEKVYELAQNLKDLKEELKNTPKGTAEYEELARQVAEAEEVVSRYDKALKDTATSQQFEQEMAEKAAEAEAKDREYLEGTISVLKDLEKQFTANKVAYSTWIAELHKNKGLDAESFVSNFTGLHDVEEELRQITKIYDATQEKIKQMNVPEDLADAYNVAINKVIRLMVDLGSEAKQVGEILREELNAMPASRMEEAQNYFGAKIDELQVKARAAEAGTAERNALLEERDYYDRILDKLIAITEKQKERESSEQRTAEATRETAEAAKEASATPLVTEKAIENANELDGTLLSVSKKLEQLKIDAKNIKLGKVEGDYDDTIKQIAYYTAMEKDLRIALDEAGRAEYEKAKAEKESAAATQENADVTGEEVNKQRAYASGLLGVIQELRDLKAEKTQLENGTWEGEGDAGKRYDYVRERITALSAVIDKYNGKVKSMKTNVRNASKSHIDLEKTLGNVKKSLKKGITMITKYVFGFRSLFFLVRKLKSLVKEGLENLVQFDSSNNATNKAITELRTSLLYLKNAWAAAVAPILNVVIPVLNMLIDAFASVGNAIARFFGALTGQSKVIQAVKADMGDYAKSLDKSAGSSGKASKAADKLHDRLAAFDDLNVLGVDKETDPNSSGGGGGGLDSDLPDISEMFTWADATKEEFKGIFDLIDSVKSKIEDSGIIEAFDNLWKAMDSFKDSEFAKVLMQIGLILADSAITSTLSVITDLINLLADALSGDLSASLMDIKSLIADLTFDPLIALANIIDLLIGTDFAGWLTDVRTSIENIKISELPGYDKLKESLSSLSDAWDKLKEALKSLWDTLEETGVLDLMKTGIEFLVKSNIDIILRGVASAISILADSIEILAGILKGDPWAALNGLKSLLADLTFEPLETILSIFDDIMGSDLAGWINNVHEVIDNFDFNDFVDSIRSGWISIVTAFKSGGVMSTSLLNSVSTKISTNKEFILKTAKMLYTGLKNVWNNIKEEATHAFTLLENAVANIWEDIKDDVRGPVNGIISILNVFIGGIEKAMNAIVEFLNGFEIDIPDWVPEVGGTTFGFDLNKVSLKRIPELAQGAVIPPNKEFLAILGDQKQGTNIEAPLDTIVNAFKEVMGNIQVEASNQVLQVDGQTFARLMTPYFVSELNRRGYNVKIIGG